MRTAEKILIPAMIILGFLMLIFIGLKMFTLDSKVSSINDTLSGWDSKLNQ